MFMIAESLDKYLREVDKLNKIKVPKSVRQKIRKRLFRAENKG